MIARTYIIKNLALINRSYLKASTQRETFFFSKLAILELCGWIEESMDDMVLKCAKRHQLLPNNHKYCSYDIVKRTYGFDYDKHFRGMLIRLVGIISVENIESRVNQSKFDSMKAALLSLKSQRDVEAHTHLKGVARMINAPSVTIAQFQPLYDGLMEFDRVIRSRKW